MPASTENPAPERPEPRVFPLWYWVIGAFALLILAWGSLFFIASQNQVETIEVAPSEAVP